jgi:gluconate 5-dehydrogenase
MRRMEAGPIDILVHNVGERDRRPFAESSRRTFARLIDVDLVAPMPWSSWWSRA